MSKSHQRNQSEDQELTEAEKIASTMSTRDYFITEESRLLDEWGTKSMQHFRFTGEVFMSEYELKSAELNHEYGSRYNELYSKCRKQFEAYCILNSKVQKKSESIENFAVYFNSKNQKRTFFGAWKAYKDKMKYIRQMEDQSERFHQRSMLKACLKAWQGITMDNIKVTIKNQVLHRTQIDISRMQSDYEKVIRTLEETLEKKLMDLKKEEEEHRLLHDKYSTMYQRTKMQETSVAD